MLFSKRSFFPFIFLLIPVFLLGGIRPLKDSVCFRVPSFENDLDFLVKGNPFLSSFQKHESENNKIKASLKTGNKILDNQRISDQICEMNSVIKIGFNDTVKQYIDLLISKRPEAACALLGLSDYYIPRFREIFTQYQIPAELAYLPSFASLYDPNSTSGNGATGYWKMTYLTGKLFNLEINSMVDERKDLICSTEAAAQYLKELFSLYNDWTLALTAFVSGPVNVNKAIRRANGKKEFWNLYPFLPESERDYLPAFIAITYVAKFHEEYGLHPFILDLSMELDTIHISRRLHFQQISKVTGLPLQEIRNLNPQYKRDILPSQKKSYILKLPVNYATRFRQMSDSLYKCCIPEDSFLMDQSDRMLQTTGSNNLYKSKQKDVTTIYYTVKSGDNLLRISGKYKVSIEDVKSWNKLHSGKIRVGQKLILHPPASGRNTGKD